MYFSEINVILYFSLSSNMDLTVWGIDATSLILLIIIFMNTCLSADKKYICAFDHDNNCTLDSY
jgi:hypothetical protein